MDVEAAEEETETEKKEGKQDQEQLHNAIRGRSDTTLGKLMEVYCLSPIGVFEIL